MNKEEYEKKRNEKCDELDALRNDITVTSSKLTRLRKQEKILETELEQFDIDHGEDEPMPKSRPRNEDGNLIF